MTGEKGFTIVELIVVLAMSGVLIGLAALQYSSMQKKSSVEKQVRDIYSNLNDVRMQALYTKTPRAVVFSESQMNIYATDDTTVTPESIITMSFPTRMSSGANRVVFDAAGLMLLAERSICVEPGGIAANEGNIDSVVVSAARIHMGKRQSGGACAPTSIDQK